MKIKLYVMNREEGTLSSLEDWIMTDEVTFDLIETRLNKDGCTIAMLQVE